MQLSGNAPMRRADRAVTDRQGIETILQHCTICHLAFATGGAPYLVPLHFGYRWEGALPTLYFHCAKEGRKLELLRQNPWVGFELEESAPAFGGENPCSWTAYFASILGEGRLEVVESPAEQAAGLGLLLRHCGFPGEATFTPAQLAAVKVLRLEVTSLSAKRHGPPSGE